MMTISLCSNFDKNPSCLKVSRTLLKNDDSLLEFRKIWRFLTKAWVLDHILEFGCVPLKLLSLSFKFNKNLT